MELRHLRYFLAVAEELHFARAAERLHIEQSPLSRAIKELEVELGAQLFVRTSRSTRLTLAGKLLMESAPRVFLALEQARESAKAGANGFHGQLRIALSDGITPSRLPALLARCREEDPETEVRLFEVPLAQQLNGLRDDLYDAGFSMADEVGDGIIVEPAWEDELMVAVPARHPLLAYKRVPPEEVLRHPLVLGDPAICEGHARQIDRILRKAVGYGIDQQLPKHAGSFLYATDVKYHSQGITISIHSSWGDGVLSAPLLGKFNVSNLLAALAVMLVLQYDFETLCQTASRLQPVTGRMECFGNSQQPLVVVDYAHTPDGLEKALQAARQHCHGRLFCIFGCGGDRDRGKRPQMAAIAEQWADTIILTDDNPRTEDPDVIIADMCAGLQKPAQAHIEHSRTCAIELALSQAIAGDIILLAGKGHEDYQIVGKEKRHYSDRETVMQLLGATS